MLKRAPKYNWFFESSVMPYKALEIKNGIKIKKKIYSGKSAYQKIEVFDTFSFGKMLVLDGISQTSEKDEFIYHEMLCHFPMFFYPNPKKVLIIGGGDGGALEEVLKYPIEKVWMVEIDQKVIEVSEKYLPSISKGAFKDKRLELVIGDGTKFIQGCQNTSGWSFEKASEIWAWIEPFAAYGFNKAHTTSYSVVSYQTAYMKANFKVEFMAALMTAESNDEDKIYEAVEECKNLGIKVLPPDINESRDDFTVVDDQTIRFGRGAIKNLGSDVIEKSIIERKANGKYQSLEDYLIRSHTKNMNKKSWEALVKAGALDAFGERGMLLANTEEVLEFVREHFRQEAAGQSSLFGKAMQTGRLKLSPAAPASKEEKLLWEKEHLGMYVSSHPLENYRAVLSALRPVKSLSLKELGNNVVMGGIISRLKKTLTKNNDPMAFFTLEDSTGNIEVLVFPKAMEKSFSFLANDKIVQVSGRLSDKDEEFKLISEDIKELPTDDLYQMALSEMEKNKQVVLHMANLANMEVLNQIKEILKNHSGNAQVYLSVGSGPGAKKIKTQSSVRVNQELINALKKIKEISKVDAS